ncbi:hypothetical protein JR338_11005 [Chloroflexota bacterium]|nr:hypothetical protein JR338_11005 [Chloroflexota bacterium]
MGVTGYWGFTGAIYPLGDESGEFDLGWRSVTPAGLSRSPARWRMVYYSCHDVFVIIH